MIIKTRIAGMLAGFTTVAVLASPALTQEPGSGRRGEEARNMRLLGKHDLAARTAYQPTIHKQGERWIAYIGHHGGRSINPLTRKGEENGTSNHHVTRAQAPTLRVHLPGE